MEPSVNTRFKHDLLARVPFSDARLFTSADAYASVFVYGTYDIDVSKHSEINFSIYNKHATRSVTWKLEACLDPLATSPTWYTVVTDTTLAAVTAVTVTKPAMGVAMRLQIKSTVGSNPADCDVLVRLNSSSHY